MTTKQTKHSGQPKDQRGPQRALEDLISGELFRALCDDTRCAIVARLACCGTPTTVSDVADCCPVDLSVVSRHLGVLRDAGIVRAERRGRQVFYTADARALADALRRIADALEACCASGEKSHEDQ